MQAQRPLADLTADVSTGIQAHLGSWKIIEIPLPANVAISRSEFAAVRSL